VTSTTDTATDDSGRGVQVTSVGADPVRKLVRERVWALLERERAAPPGVHGHIPAFVGAATAADRLATLTASSSTWRCRGWQLSCPSICLDPARLPVPFEDAASSRVAETVARKVSVGELRPVDLVVCGSVAVNRDGARLGKGAGYSDIEVALLQEAGVMGPGTTIVTTVHSLQVVDEPLPETDHDFSVDVIVTPDEVIMCGPPRRPRGLLWTHLDEEKIRAIPVLAARAKRMT
jgi:5-formyltetrahydrofolate cyclo-ligase